MKISELIEDLEALKVKHGDLIVIATDEEGTYEINEVYQSEYLIYNGNKLGRYDTQLAVRLC